MTMHRILLVLLVMLATGCNNDPVEKCVQSALAAYPLPLNYMDAENPDDNDDRKAYKKQRRAEAIAQHEHAARLGCLRAAAGK